MIYVFGGGLFVGIITYSLRDLRFVFKLRFKRPSSAVMIIRGYRFSYRSQGVLLITVVGGLILVGRFFAMNVFYLLLMGIWGCLIFILVISWLAKFSFEQKQFTALTDFLLHFCAQYKVNHKIYSCIDQCLETVSHPELLQTLQQVRHQLEQDHHLESAFVPFITRYDHFVVRNMIASITMIEQVGYAQIASVFSVLEADIDAWIEDVYQERGQLLRLRTRLLITVGLALIIAVVSLTMLKTNETLVAMDIYQVVVFTLLMILMLTTLMGFRVLRRDWIRKEECCD